MQDMIDHNHTQPWLLQCMSSGPQPARLQGLHPALERTHKQHLNTLNTGVRAQSVESRLTGGAANMMPGRDRVSRERSRRPALCAAAHLRDERGRHKGRVQRQAVREGGGQVRARALDAQLRHGVIPARADREALPITLQRPCRHYSHSPLPGPLFGTMR